MVEFVYNNTKNTSTDHTLFELNCGYHSWMSYKEEIKPRSQSKSADKLLLKLKKLIIVCCENLYYTQEL